MPRYSGLQIYAGEKDCDRRDSSQLWMRPDPHAVRSFATSGNMRRFVSANCQWRAGALPRPRRQLHLYDVLIRRAGGAHLAWGSELLGPFSGGVEDA